MGVLDTQPYKGARDFYPEDMRLRQYWERVSQGVVELFGYEPYDGPLLERQELYEAKTSEEVVRDQTYSFIDRGERPVVIRPEMTPTFARMVAARAHEMSFPLRWHSFPNLWRYEKPQKGRLREHWQLNCDVVAPEITPVYELEVFRLIRALMNAFGASEKNFVIKYNHRGVCDRLFEKQFKIASSQERQAIFYLLDRMKKVPKDTLNVMAKEKGVEMFPDIRASFEQDVPADRLFQSVKDSEEGRAFFQFLEYLEGSGLQGCVAFDPSMVRGFQYYTGLVFEVEDTHPDNRRAIVGGGRYDNLIGYFSKQQLQGVGFGWGDVTFGDFLRTHGLLPEVKVRKGCVILAGEDVAQYAMKVQDGAVRQGVQSRLVVTPAEKMFKTGLKTALKFGTPYIIIVGSQERAAGKVVLKDVVKHQDSWVVLEEALKKIFEGAVAE